MSLARLKQLNKTIESLIVTYERTNFLAPISFLEEAQENIEHAIEEFSLAIAEEEED